MKHLITLLTALILFWGCSDNGAGSGGGGGDENTFVSSNVKTDGTVYFSFSGNSGSTTEPAEWDLAFSTVPVPVE